MHLPVSELADTLDVRVVSGAGRFLEQIEDKTRNVSSTWFEVVLARSTVGADCGDTAIGVEPVADILGLGRAVVEHGFAGPEYSG